MNTRIIAVFLSMVIGHLFSPVVRGEDLNMRDRLLKFRLRTADMQRPIAPKLKPNPNIVIRPDGAILKTDADGWTMVITPGERAPAESDTEDFCGFQIPKSPPESIGSYDASQNQMVAKSHAYNAGVAKSQASAAKRNSSGYAGYVRRPYYINPNGGRAKAYSRPLN